MRALPVTIGISFIVFAACQHTPVEPEKPTAFPAVVSVGVYINTNNVLSAIVAVRATNAATVAIEFGSDSLFTQCTPLVHIAGDSARLPVLGLKANRSYTMRAVAISASGHKTHSAPFSFQTPSLPDGLPRFSVVARQTPSTGFVMLGFATTEIANTYYALIIDNDGEIVWYKRFPRPVVDFQKQVNGVYTVFSSMAMPLKSMATAISWYRFATAMKLPKSIRALAKSSGGWAARTTSSHLSMTP